MNEHAGKNYLVAGASSGIGLCLSRKLAALGARVLLLARNREKLDQALGSLSSGKPNFLYLIYCKITLDCIYHVVNRPLRDDDTIPIGKPFRNTSILLLNENDEPIGSGEEGELCIRGSSLAMGYYNNPEKTAAAFVQNPLHHAYPELIYRTGDIVAWNEYGELVFRGRKDALIKHLGYRIELAEIEHVVINTLKLAANCCALYIAEHKKIILVYEAKSPLPEKELRQRISEILPRYMVPSVYMQIDEMPQNTNGKINRLKVRNIAGY